MPKAAYIDRDFHDAGTDQRFTGGTTVPDLPDGQFENYAAAGLVTEAGAAPAEPAITVEQPADPT